MVLVAENVKKIIDKKGFKQTAIARRAGIKETSFNNMLHGRKIISADDVYVLAKVLEVSPNELFFFNNEDDTFTKKE